MSEECPRCGFSAINADEVEHWGAEVRSARRDLGMTQRALAKDLGVSGATMCLIEKGRVRARFDVAHRIADLLGVELPEWARRPSRPPSSPVGPANEKSGFR